MEKKNFWKDLYHFIENYDFKKIRYIGSRKIGSLNKNPWLWIPFDEFKDLLKNTSELDEKVFNSILKYVEKGIEVIEPELELFCKNIPSNFGDKETESKIFKTFFYNKYLSDSVYLFKKCLNSEPTISPYDWVYNEFVIPNWLSIISNGIQDKAIRIIVDELKEKNHPGIKQIPKINERQEFINRIIIAQNKLKLQKPGKLISKRQVAKELKIPYTTFTDMIKKQKIKFDEL
jgi:hypothetical protein